MFGLVIPTPRNADQVDTCRGVACVNAAFKKLSFPEEEVTFPEEEVTSRSCSQLKKAQRLWLPLEFTTRRLRARFPPVLPFLRPKLPRQVRERGQGQTSQPWSTFFTCRPRAWRRWGEAGMGS